MTELFVNDHEGGEQTSVALQVVCEQGGRAIFYGDLPGEKRQVRYCSCLFNLQQHEEHTTARRSSCRARVVHLLPVLPGRIPYPKDPGCLLRVAQAVTVIFFDTICP